MAITHGITAQNAATNAVVDLLDAGSTRAAAQCVLLTSGNSTLSVMLMASAAAFSASTAGVATGLTAQAATSGIFDDPSPTAGTIAKGVLQDHDVAAIINFACGVSGSDMNLSKLAIASGDTIAITSLTYQALTA